MAFSITLTPRFYETDAMGHINNAAIAAWFEVARISFLESLDQSGSAAGRNWVLASLKMDFVAETFYGGDVTAVIRGARVGNSSVTVDCEMRQNSAATVRGVAILVYFDLDSRQTRPVPDTLRQRIEAYRGVD